MNEHLMEFARFIIASRMFTRFLITEADDLAESGAFESAQHVREMIECLEMLDGHIKSVIKTRENLSDEEVDEAVEKWLHSLEGSRYWNASEDFRHHI